MTSHRRPTSSLIHLTFLHLLLVLLLSWAGGSLAFAAGEIQVNSANPSTAEQGTLDLDVTIKGAGFDTGAQVDFFLAGNPTNPGGITVNDVRRKGPKQLTATIDIDVDADIATFDIRVISNGSTAIGAGLFTVTEETGGGGPPPGGGDTIPPGAVTDLSLDGQTGFNMIPVTWTATADDGYEAASGPAKTYSFRFSLDGPLDDANWDIYNRVDYGSAWGEAPGTIQYLVLADKEFGPDTLYHFAIRATDFADNSSLVSSIQVTTGPLPETSWVKKEVDACPGSAADFDYDYFGNPMFVYTENCNGQTQTILARWSDGEFVPEDIDVAVEGASFFATDPDGEPTMIGYDKGKLYFYRRNGSSWNAELIERRNARGAHLVYSEAGFPAVAYRMPSPGGNGSCWLARSNGAGWDKEVVDPSTACSGPRLAFDAAGNPALAYRDNLLVEEGLDRLDTLKFAYWDPDAAAWVVEIVDQTPGYIVNRPTLAYDPSRLGFSAVYEREREIISPDGRIKLESPGVVRFCDRNAEWSCEVVEELDGQGILTYDIDGRAYFGYETLYSVGLAIRAPGSVDWVKEMIDWGGGFTSIKLGPGGMAGINYGPYRQSNPNGYSLIFASRPIP